MENQTKPEPLPTIKISDGGFIAKYLNNPILNLLWGVIGTVGVVFGFYTYYAQKPNLACYSSPTRTPIVRKMNFNNLTVSVKGEVITNDIYLATIQIWNRGDVAINHEDILEPFKIKTVNGEKIYQVNRGTTRDVIGLHFYPDADTNTDSAFTFDWKILEKDDGIIFQVLYGGNASSPLSVNGVIKGQKQITAYQIGQRDNPKIFYASYFIFVVLASTLGAKIVNRAKKEFPQFAKSGNAGTVQFMVICGSMYIFPHIVNYLFPQSPPPFGL